jgi:hypothetical protein
MFLPPGELCRLLVLMMSPSPVRVPERAHRLLSFARHPGEQQRPLHRVPGRGHALWLSVLEAFAN